MRERGGEERWGREVGRREREGERWGGEMGERGGEERERERGGEERERGGEVGRRERGREGVGSYFTDQRGVRGTVRECVCLWRV